MKKMTSDLIQIKVMQTGSQYMREKITKVHISAQKHIDTFQKISSNWQYCAIITKKNGSKLSLIDCKGHIVPIFATNK